MTERYTVAKYPSNTVFVFGSNLAGWHGAGAALDARNEWGARPGVGIGRTGRAYALPTKDEQLQPLSLERIRAEVARFLLCAVEDHGSEFLVTRVGCGLAGYTEDQIAPMFRAAPDNCILPSGWREIADRSVQKFRQAVVRNGAHPWTGEPGWDVLRVVVRSDQTEEDIDDYVDRASEEGNWRLFIRGTMGADQRGLVFYKPHSYSGQWVDLRP